MTAIRALFFAANPQGLQPLNLDVEIREIKEKLRSVDSTIETRVTIELIPVLAARTDDLLQNLNAYHPQIVHFSGHGSPSGELALLNGDGTAKAVSPAAIKALFQSAHDQLQVILFNTCQSLALGQAVSEIVDYTVCMEHPIQDQAAIIFSTTFYQALAYGRTVGVAFEQGQAALLLDGYPEEKLPVLLSKKTSSLSTSPLIAPKERITEQAEAGSQSVHLQIVDQNPAHNTGFPLARLRKPPRVVVDPLPEDDESDAHDRFHYPFGEVAFENELAVLKSKYQSYYYAHSRFNSYTLDPDSYLIIGRRGSGKSSLAKYLEFQNRIRHTGCINITNADEYDAAFRDLIFKTSLYEMVVVASVSRIWEYILWTLIFDHLREADPVIGRACVVSPLSIRPSLRIVEILAQLHSKGQYAVHLVEAALSSLIFASAQKAVLRITQKAPLLIALDTMERYDKNNDALMKMTAALIECASRFNVAYARSGIYLKVFIAAEIYPYLKETEISNSTKHIREPVFLHWRPRDLVRLICWRFDKFLQSEPAWQKYAQPTLHWENFDEVLGKLWYPFWGETLFNANRHVEDSFPYLLRHTQMRPRQLVILCNAIAKSALQQRVFPMFWKLNIPEILRQQERELADEVINSYSMVYPQVGEILDALRVSPRMFDGSYLDSIAKLTASAWPSKDEYSLFSFRRLVAELGIVGRVRHYDEKSGVVAADFEYTLTDRLALRSNDQCVIHPMFYSKLETKKFPAIIVYPFPDHPDYQEVQR